MLGSAGLKNLLPRTFFGRSLLILVTPIILIQIISTIVFFDRHWSKMTMRLANAVAGEITVIARALEQGTEADKVMRIIGYAADNLDLLVSFEQGERLADKDLESQHDALWESVVAQTLSQELRNQLGQRPFVMDVDFEEKWVQIAVQLDNGILNVSLPQRRLFSSSGYIFLLWMVGSSLVLLLVAIIFMRNQVRPIRRLAIAAEAFGKGNDYTRFKPEGAREVRQAGAAFIDMRRRIKRQIEQRTSMLAAISHDLRTPLTRLKLQLAMWEENDDSRAMRDDIEIMEKMIGGYLDFVRDEGEEEPETISLAAIVERVVEQARRQGQVVDLDIAENITLKARPLAFERCLINLVNNAGQYAPQCWVKLYSVGGQYAEISIEDNGPGIDEEHYEDVFKPFFRGESARNNVGSGAAGGTGLGLAIAQDIVNAHGGKIILDRSEHSGLKVRVSIPL